MREKREEKILFLLVHYNDQIIVNTEKQRSSTDEKLFELLRIENDFPKYFAKCHNLFRSFLSHITVILGNYTFLYTFLYYKKNQISLKYKCCIILRKTFLEPEYMK